MDTIQRIRHSAEQFPERTAYKVQDSIVSYRQLWDKAQRYALLLRKQGNSPVIVYGHKSTDIVITILACLIAKRPYVPIEEGTPLLRIEKIIGQTEATLLITEKPLTTGDILCLSLSDLERFSDATEFNCESIIAYIIFTSGSTGEPKGVPISRSNLDNFTGWISELTTLKEYGGITVFNQASFSFDLSVADLYYSLCNGHTLLSFGGNITDDFNGFFNVLKEADVAVMTPSLARLCLVDASFEHTEFPKLKCIYFCGERLEVKTVRKLFKAFPDIKIINAYGPTEATSAVSAVEISEEMVEKELLLPVGRIDTAATGIELLDDEIVLKGKSVFGGYLGGIAGGLFKESGMNCYRTGDLGYIKDGYLYCTGRADSQIKFMGYRIELQEIEHHINEMVGVSDSAVVASYDSNGTVKAIKAYVEADASLSAEDIKKYLAQRIPHYMIPKVIKTVNSLPLNDNGKVDRKALENL